MKAAPTLERGTCPVCSGADLLPSVVLASVPVLCNALHPDAASAREAPTGRFVTKFCRSCAHVFNAAFDPDRVGYTQNYENSLHFSARFVEFVDALVARLHDRYRLCGKKVVDIGCGKGEFLTRLCLASGAKGVGFDRSFEAARDVAIPGVRFVADWFGDAYADVRPDLITCRHVLEHIAEPLTFLRTLRGHPGLAHSTVLYLEVPNALYTLRDLGIWDLIYEHVSYFTPLSLETIVTAAGFQVLDQGISFGGQYLYVEAAPGITRAPMASPQGENVETFVRNFSDAYEAKVQYWGEFFAAHDPRQIIVWGAGSKGVTFVNTVNGADGIVALVDVNPHKRGQFVPGAGVEVLAPQALLGRKLKSAIVLNPLYRAEIATIATGLGLELELLTA